MTAKRKPANGKPARLPLVGDPANYGNPLVLISHPPEGGGVQKIEILQCLTCGSSVIDAVGVEYHEAWHLGRKERRAK